MSYSISNFTPFSVFEFTSINVIIEYIDVSFVCNCDPQWTSLYPMERQSLVVDIALLHYIRMHKWPRRNCQLDFIASKLATDITAELQYLSDSSNDNGDYIC